MVDEALDHTGRLDVLQVLFTEDDGHLRDTRPFDLLIKPLTQTCTPFTGVGVQE